MFRYLTAIDILLIHHSSNICSEPALWARPCVNSGHPNLGESFPLGAQSGATGMEQLPRWVSEMCEGRCQHGVPWQCGEGWFKNANRMT